MPPEQNRQKKNRRQCRAVSLISTESRSLFVFFQRVRALPAGVAAMQLMPVGDFFFAELPAQINIAALVAAGKVDQAALIVLQFDADASQLVDIILKLFEG